MNEMSVKDLTQGFYKEKSFFKEQTKAYYRHVLKSILSFFKEYNINHIKDFKREHSIDFVAYLRARNNKNSTIKQHIKTLKALLRYALELEEIEKIHFAKFKLQDSLSEIENSELRPFDLKEIQNLINNAKGELKSYLIVAFFTGARTGELLGLKKSDIDFLDKKISVRRSLSQNNMLDTPKNKSSFRKMDLLPIVENELKVICKNKKDDDFIFKMRRNELRKEFKALQERLNIYPLRRLYDTRHSFASVMLSQGEESMWISKVMLGHSDLNTTFKYYAKYLPKNVTNRALFLNELKIS